MKTTTTRRFAALLLAAPLALSACGGSSGSDASGTASPADTAAASESASPAATSSESASASASESGAATGGVAPGDAQPGQAIDAAKLIEDTTAAHQQAKTYAMAMDMTGPLSGQKMVMKIDGVADVTDQASPKIKMNMNVTSPEAMVMEMIFVDKTSFLKMPQTGAKYIRMPLEDMTQLPGQDLSKAFDPSAQLAAQKSAVKSGTFVGEEDVDGAKTRHYKLTMDVAAVGKLAGATLPSAQASALTNVPYELWVDEENRTRKFTMKMNTGSDPMDVTGTMSKFGEPVTIEAPPSSETTTMPTAPAGPRPSGAGSASPSK